MFFTKFWQKKVSAIEKRMSSEIDAVTEFDTGVILAKSKAVEIEYRGRWGQRSTVFFREDNAPECDYIIEDYNGELRYFKHQADIQVNRDGSIYQSKEKKNATKRN